MKKMIIVLLPILFLMANCDSKSGGGGGAGGIGGLGGGDGTKVGTVGSVLNINGVWKGTGSFEFNNQTEACAQVEFEFKQAATQLKILKGNYDCVGTTKQWDVVEVDIQAGNLTYQGQKVGTISSDEVIIEYAEANESLKVTIKRKAGTSILTIKEEIVVAQGQAEFSGTLKLQ